ncbi:protein kinase [Tessaracoccus sp. ZS01]|uniref:protein kinase domain-containing protein n=1 Tax=Tessaracoccus sp. ZS01 TaxID=1906324 RepID=UPI00096E853D|nr:protein kinase [Tessaracoccus sp. ZS01]MCG6568085.1 hypothetical protein [Tessaracoccus sp. ZS01]OMG54164.1 hypothetical protein BJN44_10725 [Tessaracoccus sp. ZS01]
MTADPVSWATALCGQAVGPYRLRELIGYGGFGLVFSADDVRGSSQVAVKILMPSTNPQSAIEFATEGRLLDKLNKCDAVVTLVDSGQFEIEMSMNGFSIPLELKYHILNLAGGSLDELTADPDRLGELAWPERISLWRGAIKGVHQMHLKSIVHRDIKAENCLLVVRGKRTEVRIADLGRSRDTSAAPTLAREEYLGGRGDLRFAAPELLWLQGGQREEDFRAADLYGLGSLLAELATGHPMTSVAMDSWRDAVDQGRDDLRKGTRRDLAVLQPQYRRAVTEVVEQMPPSIRLDSEALLSQLCHPVPIERFPRVSMSSRRSTQPGLEWLLQRADILAKRLSIEEKMSSAADCRRRRA